MFSTFVFFADTKTNAQKKRTKLKNIYYLCNSSCMKSTTHILTLLISLLVFASSNAFACKNTSVKASSEKMTCSSKDNHYKKPCCNKDKKHDKGCSGACCNFFCHYPNSISIPFFQNDFKLSNTNNFETLNVNWTYVQHIPKDIYLSIWLPPK